MKFDCIIFEITALSMDACTKRIVLYAHYSEAVKSIGQLF